jgi:hypothetical protein
MLPAPVPPPPTTAAYPLAKKPGPPLWLGLGTLIIGFVVGIIGLIPAVNSVIKLIDADPRTTPGSFTIDLDKKGEYGIFLEADSSNRVDPAIRIDPAEVSIVAPDGAAVSVTNVSQNRTEDVEIGGRNYVATLRFEVRQLGEHRFTFANTNETSVVVNRTLVGVFTESPWILIAIVVGTLLFWTGVVLLIVMAVRRSRARKRLAVRY